MESSPGRRRSAGGLDRSEYRNSHKDTDSCEERAAVVKLEHLLVVRQMAQSQAVLSWDTCRCLVGKVGNQEISAQGHRMFADEIVERGTAGHLLQGLAKPKRRFSVAALGARMRGEQLGAVAPPVAQPAQSQAASGPQQEPGVPLPVAAPGSSRRWVMVRWLGAPQLHLLQDGSGTPLHVQDATRRCGQTHRVACRCQHRPRWA